MKEEIGAAPHYGAVIQMESVNPNSFPLAWKTEESEGKKEWFLNIPNAYNEIPRRRPKSDNGEERNTCVQEG